MIQKKICMLGAFAVGKTSLVARYVHSMFSDKYHSTVGVKIDKRQVQVKGQDVTMMLWDLAGEDELMKVRTSYLKGASGYLLVIDRTRLVTYDVAMQLHQRVINEVGEMPFIVLLNKSDLVDQFDIPQEMIDTLKQNGWTVIETSAKEGVGVAEAFETLAARTLE
ncbi:MAG: GTP-binding protein [Planctomycetes bacterium]|nr:GTP-binding protein [Planctomycetota bacterium]